MLNQNSSSQNQFWSLLSKKLSKEASSEELQELQSILLNNPDLHHHADMLTEMWQQRAVNNSDGSEAAYIRHIMKHKDEFFVEENPIEINSDGPVSETNPGFFRTLISKKRFTVFSFLALIVLTTGSIYLFTKKRDTKLTAVQAITLLPPVPAVRQTAVYCHP